MTPSHPPKLVPTASVDVEVRYAETDQMGVVHHAEYLVWLELARTRLCELSGTSYAEIESGGHYLVVTGATLRYRGSARYGDTVTVDCRVEEMGSRRLVFGYSVRRGDEVLVTGSTEHVWVDRSTGRPCRIPKSLVEPFRRLAGEGRPDPVTRST